MIEADFLTRAVDRGLITRDQACALQHLAEERPDAAAIPRDDEGLRFVSGFADIFVTIGLLLFLGTTAYFGTDRLGAASGYGLVALVTWGLAEFFTRRRRMALPSIVLLVIFTIATFGAATFAIDAATGGSDLDTLWGNPFLLLDRRPLPVAGGSLLTLILVAGHYRRFGVPITVAAGAAALVGIVGGLLAAAAPASVQAHGSLLLLAAGIGIFTLAMRFDLSDPGRTTRRTDIAFWLHLLAAPLIVHPILGRVALADRGDGLSAGLVLAIVLILTAVALATDRRAILVSGLVYAGFAFGTLIRQAGFSGGILPASLLMLGAFILLLSAGWHPLRKRVLRALPRSWAARLPHPLGA